MHDSPLIWFVFFFLRNISFPKKTQNWSAQTDQQDLIISCWTICAQAAYGCDYFSRKEFAEKTTNVTVDNLQRTETSSVNYVLHFSKKRVSS